jgi:hypothetical protein
MSCPECGAGTYVAWSNGATDPDEIREERHECRSDYCDWDKRVVLGGFQ